MPTKLFSSWKVHKAALGGSSLEWVSVGGTVTAWHLVQYSAGLPRSHSGITVKVGHSTESNRPRKPPEAHKERINFSQLRVAGALGLPGTSRPKPSHSRCLNSIPSRPPPTPQPTRPLQQPHNTFTYSGNLLLVIRMNSVVTMLAPITRNSAFPCSVGAWPHLRQ